jgi:iron complex transport system substrate-binding protein
VPGRARALAASLQKRINAVETVVRRARTHPRVFYEIDSTLYTAGHGSFIDALITLAGGVNIAGTVMNPYPQLSAEKVIAADPQYIILSDARYGTTVASVAARPGWSRISAVRHHHVYPFNDDLASRPGPRIVLGLETLARLLHPELFH